MIYNTIIENFKSSRLNPFFVPKVHFDSGAPTPSCDLRYGRCSLVSSAIGDCSYIRTMHPISGYYSLFTKINLNSSSGDIILFGINNVDNIIKPCTSVIYATTLKITIYIDGADCIIGFYDSGDILDTSLSFTFTAQENYFFNIKKIANKYVIDVYDKQMINVFHNTINTVPVAAEDYVRDGDIPDSIVFGSPVNDETYCTLYLYGIILKFNPYSFYRDYRNIEIIGEGLG